MACSTRAIRRVVISSPAVKCALPLRNELTADFVRGYLTSHPTLLDHYVMETVTIDQLEEWLKKKNERIQSRHTGVSCTKSLCTSRYADLSVLRIQEELINDMSDTEDCLEILYEICSVLAAALTANGMSMYVAKESKLDLYIYVPPTSPNGDYRLKIYGPVSLNTTVAAHVSYTHEAVLVNATEEDANKFPNWIGVEDSLVNSVICVPMMLPNKDMICVMEFTRSLERSQFCNEDLQLAICTSSWIGMAIYETHVNKMLVKQAELNDFLLNVTKTFFDGIVTQDRLVEQIMIYAKDLVKADRCALFLVDKENKELYSNLFDDGTELNGVPVFKKGDEIRFSRDKGIAGYVAQTGNNINIADVYKDTRFNRNIDMETGYLTKSILCMPIVTHGNVKGVAEMLNKRSLDGYFTTADEDAFKMFAVYCALALHYQEMYNEIKVKTASFRIAMEQVVYHAKASDEEVKEFIRKPLLNPADVPKDLDSFAYVITEDLEYCQHMLLAQMMNNLFGPNSFSLPKLCQFILTVQRNYRPLPYHNWSHGWATAQSMYCMLTRLIHRQPPVFSELTMKGLMIASLCHDIDHRGLSNAFMSDYNQPLHVIYKSSIMEQHHYATIVKIIQQDGHDIFSSLSLPDFSYVLRVMEKAILATDLATYFRNRLTIKQLLDSAELNYEENEQHMDMIISLLMSSVDLSGCCKPFPLQYEIALRIFEEFYEQGDAEKSMGKKPQPMMDRDRIECIPQDEVSFLQYVCVPCYTLLTSIFPEFMELLSELQKNLARWKEIASNPPGEESWAQRISIVTMAHKTGYVSNQYVTPVDQMFD